MPQFLLDTDHLTLYERGHALVVARVDAQPLTAVGLSVITAEEALRGRLVMVARAHDGATRLRSYAQLLGTVQLLTEFVVAPFDQASETEFQQLLRQKLRVGTQDLKIAAVALVNRLPSSPATSAISVACQGLFWRIGPSEAAPTSSPI